VDQALSAHDQRPVFKTNITEFVPLRRITPSISLEALRRISLHFPRPDFQFKLDPSYEESNSPQHSSKTIEPFAEPSHVAVFKDLQNYHRVGLLLPLNAPYMYYAAMHSDTCRLTPLGMHYWRLVKRLRI
jgi:hypothetical protein